MQQAEYAQHYAVEDRHWYFASKRAILAEVARAAQVHGRILDLGSGTGGNLELLSRFGRVYAVDYHADAARACC